MTDFVNLPDYNERKGSLFLRSDHMNYSRATLNSNWHQAREAEPKNYDINKAPKRDLRKTTYDRIGDVTDGRLPFTTYQDHAAQIYMKKDFTEKETHKPMINAETFAFAGLDRLPAEKCEGFGSVLPHHHPEHKKVHLATTHRSDYRAPFPFTPAPECPPDFDDNSLAYKRCHSQFSDTDDYRRRGRNTWHDESGWYMNSHFKQQVKEYQITNPIPLAL